jgi:hypothetical protein
MPRSPRWPSHPVSQRKSSAAKAASVASGSMRAKVYSKPTGAVRADPRTAASHRPLLFVSTAVFQQ